jgi:hypothetical protein
MDLIVQRSQPSASGLAWPGELLIDDQHFCWTVERGPKVPDYPPIPLGSYEGVLSVSPHLGYLCPLLAVPNRTGIRMHVANYWSQLEGCVALGLLTGVGLDGEPAVFSSRAALDKLLAVLSGTFVVSFRQGA